MVVMAIDVLNSFDLVVECFCLLTALIIASFSFHVFLLTKQRRHEVFSIAFFLLSAGIFLSVLFNAAVQFEKLSIVLRGYLGINYFWAFILFGSMILVLAGYLTILIVNEEIKSRKVIALLYVFSLLSAIVAHEVYILYHLIVVLVVAMLFGHFYRNYRVNTSNSSLLVMLAFASILVSEFLFALVIFDPVFYNLGNILRLVGFLLLLFSLISIYWGGKRK